MPADTTAKAFAAREVDEVYFAQDHLLRLFASAPTAFWRFDVDVSLPAARSLAELAQVGGIEATFCLMSRSGLYNLFSPEGRYTVETIANRGHRVVPHCLKLEHVIEDLALFDRAFPRCSDPFVSFHMPGPDVLWQDFLGFDHGHASRWQGHYLSDSRGEPLSRAPGSGDQVALHAEWWFR